MLLDTIQQRSGLNSTADYAGYHRFATRKLKKLRKRDSLSVKATNVYEPKQLLPSQWPLLILQAERSWAKAMVARSALEADAAAAKSLKNAIVAKLAKATKHAVTASKLVGNDNLEFQIYASLLAGEQALEKQQWRKVITLFSQVRLGVLALQAKQSQIAQDVFDDLLKASIDPTLRLALAQEDDKYEDDLTEVARKSVSPEFANILPSSVMNEESASQQIKEIHFRNYKAQVHYNNLAHILLQIRAKESVLTEKLGTNDVPDLSMFDEALSAWNQLEISARDLSAEINTAGQPREQDLDIIITYAQFHLLSRRIQRDSIVASRETGANAVRLYEVLLQSCDVMAELPGVNGDDELLEGISSMKLYFQTLRTLELADLRHSGSAEALALLNLAHKRFQTNPKIPVSVILPVSQEDLSKVSIETDQKVARAYALNVMYNEVANRSSVRGSLATDVGFKQFSKDYQRPVILADYAAQKLDPVAVKPIYYDIAFNHVQEATLTDADIENSNSKKSIFGLFK